VSSLWPLVRGRVYAAKLSHVGAEKFFLVVSNNRRNAGLPQVLAARLTTTPKPNLPSIVQLAHPEVFVGTVLCDDITEIYEDEVRRDLGALSPTAMQSVGQGLTAALGLY
jgi:mRNA interferase MazF